MDMNRKYVALWVPLYVLPALLAGCQSSSGGGGGGLENDNAAAADLGAIRLSAPPVDAGASAPTYLWRQTDGPEVSLGNRTRSELTFLPPDVPEDTVLHFVVTVTVNGEPQDFEFEVTVPGQDSVAPTGQRPPAADAGSSQNVQVGDTVVLDASASLDPDGDRLSFAWTQSAPAGAGEPTPVTLQDAATVRASFQATEAGVFYFAVAVSDGHYTVTAMTKVEVVLGGGEAPPVSGNVPPSLTITSPIEDLTVVQGEQLEISWTDSDRDSAALVSFALLDASDPDQVIPLVEGLPENDLDANLNPTPETFTVSTAVVLPGDYYIRGTIDDGVNAPVVTFATTVQPGTDRVILSVTGLGFDPG